MAFLELNRGYKYNTLTHNMIKEMTRFLNVIFYKISHIAQTIKLNLFIYNQMIKKEYFHQELILNVYLNLNKRYWSLNC